MGVQSLKESLELRKTKQRKKLLDIFSTNKKPMTADQILKYCHLECPNMALTTVYRNLDKLIELGYINKTIYPDGAARYSPVDAGHHHMVTCRICHAQVEITNCPVNISEELISEETGYKIEHHYLEFFGICPNCLKSDLAFQRKKVELPGVHQADDIEDDDYEQKLEEKYEEEFEDEDEE